MFATKITPEWRKRKKKRKHVRSALKLKVCFKAPAKKTPLVRPVMIPKTISHTASPTLSSEVHCEWSYSVLFTQRSAGQNKKGYLWILERALLRTGDVSTRHTSVRLAHTHSKRARVET